MQRLKTLRYRHQRFLPLLQSFRYDHCVRKANPAQIIGLIRDDVTICNKRMITGQAASQLASEGKPTPIGKFLKIHCDHVTI